MFEPCSWTSTDHLKQTTRIDQHIVQSEIHITLINLHIGHNLCVFNLLLEHFQSSLHDRRDSSFFQTKNQKIRVQFRKSENFIYCMSALFVDLCLIACFSTYDGFHMPSTQCNGLCRIFQRFRSIGLGSFL
jgi:hypothetical protein